MDVQKALAPSEAGRRLVLSKAMVCLLCRQGRLRAVKTALGWLIDPDDVERLRKEREKKAIEETTAHEEVCYG